MKGPERALRQALRRRDLLRVAAGGIAALVLTRGIGAAQAHGDAYEHGSLTVHQPWARATAASAKNGAVYLTINNDGAASRFLTAATTDVADMVQIHDSTEVDGVAQMRMVDAIEIPAGAMVEVKPGGLHLMLIGLKAPLVQGTSFPMTLVFDTEGEIEVEVTVEGPGATEPHAH